MACDIDGVSDRDISNDPEWIDFKRQWGVDGMPLDKQRLAEAAYRIGLKYKFEQASK